jgi:hypothetical protein
MQKNIPTKFPFVFNQIEFSEDINSTAILTKKMKVIDMLEKHDFINQNFNITDFDRGNNEIKSKIESLLPKYEEYSRECLQNESKYFKVTSFSLRNTGFTRKTLKYINNQCSLTILPEIIPLLKEKKFLKMKGKKTLSISKICLKI